MANDVETLATSLMSLLASGAPRNVTAISETAADAIRKTGPSGPMFWRGLPWLNLECSTRWLGDRLFFFPKPVVAKNRISVVSSRFRQRLDLESRWFDLLRTTVLRCDAATDVLLVVDTTTAFQSVSRSALLFGRPVVRFVTSSLQTLSASGDICEWLSELPTVSESISDLEGDDRVLNVYVSPRVNGISALSSEPEISLTSLPDRLLFAAASRIHVLSASSNGNVARLLKRHLCDSSRSDTPVLIASDEQGQMPAVADDLPSSWVPWLVEPLKPEGSIQGDELSQQAESQTDNLPAEIQKNDVSSPLSEPDAWLTHWTRASRGPWPGETQDDFLDALILRTETSDRSAMASLLRIVSDGVLVASSEGIRGRYRVVAFTEVPLHEFRIRRVFRKHRNRFDFEPWGVAIRKSELTRLGAAPVIYGDGSEWKNMSSEERPFFQKASDSGATNNRAEREWRVLRDIQLRLLDKNAVCIFVENVPAAELVRRHCEWPVVVLP